MPVTLDDVERALQAQDSGVTLPDVEHELARRETPEYAARGDPIQAYQEGRLLDFLKARGQLLFTSPEFRGNVARTATVQGAPVVTGYLTGGASMPLQAGAQMLTEYGMQQTGVTPQDPTQVATAGMVETAGNIGPRVLFEGFRAGLRGVLSRTRGAKTLFREQAITGATEAARAAREDVLADTAAAKRALQGETLEARRVHVQEQAALDVAKQHVQEQASQVRTLQERGLSAQQRRLEQLGPEEIDTLARRFSRVGQQATTEAITAGYQAVNDAARGYTLSRAPLDDALATIHPRVQRELQPILSRIPQAPRARGAGPEPALERPPSADLSFAQVRAIQQEIGPHIRQLERQVGRGDDTAYQRLDALKKVYASTFDVLDQAVAKGDLPATVLEQLKDANHLNRAQAMFERLNVLREVKGTRYVAGEPVFDANSLLTAIKGDAFLTRQLTDFGVYDGLTDTLGRIAAQQKSKLPPAPTVGKEIAQAGRERGREYTLEGLERTEAGQAVTTESAQALKTIDEQLEERLRQINQQHPEVGATNMGFQMARVLGGGAVGGGLTGSAEAGMGVSAVLAGLEGIAHWLVTPQGQRQLAQLFGENPTITPAKLGFLLQSWRGQGETARETAASPP